MQNILAALSELIGGEKSTPMSQAIVFVHGAFVTPACWDPFKGYFESRGYTCLAPAWPHKDRSVEELRSNPPAGLSGLGIQEIVAHYQRIIEDLDAPPILIGHSYGGLFVQMLLDRGLGSAGVAINPAPPKGVLPFHPSTVRSLLPVLLTPFGWRRTVILSPSQFNYAFVNALPEYEQTQVYKAFVTRETGRIFFQSALMPFNRASYVNFDNSTRAPLLITAGSKDQIVPPQMNRVNYRRYRHSQAVTDFKEFEGRCHWIIAQPGWEEVAEYVEGWLNRVLPQP